MYILKTEGTDKIPDHIQIRDDQFFLLAYFKVSSPKTALARIGLSDKTDEILDIASRLEYGKIKKLEL
jgi:hypothetical protein